MSTIISGMGCVLPEKIVLNSEFVKNKFYEKNGTFNDKNGQEVVAKLEAITGIRERRYIPDDEDSIPLMAEASRRAIEDSGLDFNQIDGIIVAHNAGNMLAGERAYQTVPNMAALLKNALKISNYECFAYDILFGCPGWVQGLIQAHQAISMGDANHVLVVGIEVASRLIDPHDLDSMIFADGCGACVLSKSDDESKGILSYATYSHAQDDLNSIYLGKSNLAALPGVCYVHMNGREVYKYATTWVPKVIKKALEKQNLGIDDVDMFLFHQANEKMLTAIANNIATLFGKENTPFDGKIPMIIQFTGNTSVATVPTMLDMILKHKLDGYHINNGDLVVMSSVGAGMHCNALVYQF